MFVQVKKKANNNNKVAEKKFIIQFYGPIALPLVRIINILEVNPGEIVIINQFSELALNVLSAFSHGGCCHGENSSRMCKLQLQPVPIISSVLLFRRKHYTNAEII